MSNVYIGLVHYPIYNKNNEIVTTAVTNFDIHDIARTARTYNISNYYIIHPHAIQQDLVGKVLEYWQEGFGSTYNVDRKEAFSIVNLKDSIEDCIEEITIQEGERPIVVTTDARVFPNTISYNNLRDKISNDNRPCLVLFGTGWGIKNEVMENFDYILEPIYGPGDYNHLPVRSAVAIILDRLLGETWSKK